MTQSPRGRNNESATQERSYSQGANNTFTQGFGLATSQKKRVKQIRRENGWDSYVKPISKYNEKVHGSMKISFERI